MAIRIITGKPGGGKSYWCLREVIEELRWGTRVIVTNLPLDLPALNAYLQEVDKEHTIDLHDRIRILSEDETKFFFAHRNQGLDFKVPSEEETKRGVRIDYGDISKYRPVFYIIDEAHVHFDARAWMNSGPHLTYYNSQHRKPGDEVFFVTQFTALLDKRCTGFAQEFISCRNYGYERLGMIKGPKGQHVATISLSPPGPSVVVMATVYFRLDLKIAACYSTTSGVGISGRSAKPREKETRGLHWGYAAVAIAAAFALLWYAPDLLTKGMLAAIGKGTNAVTAVSDSVQHKPNDGESNKTALRDDHEGQPVRTSPFTPYASAGKRGDGLPDGLSVVLATMVVGGEVLVRVKDEEGFSPVRRIIGDGALAELANGIVVRRRDVINPRPPKPPAPPPDEKINTPQPREAGRFLAASMGGTQ